MAAFDLDSYATVQERIAQFYQRFPQGSILTEKVWQDGAEVQFRAWCYRNPEEQTQGIIFAVGHAREIEGKTPVNRTSHFENCESRSVGWMLANAGFAPTKQRPTREEMTAAARQQADHDQTLAFLRDAGERAAEDLTVPLPNGNQVRLRDHLRTHWRELKSRPSQARVLADAIQSQTDEDHREAA